MAAVGASPVIIEHASSLITGWICIGIHLIKMVNDDPQKAMQRGEQF